MQLKLIFPGESYQTYLFGDKVSPEEREQAIEEAREEAQAIWDFEEVKKRMK